MFTSGLLCHLSRDELRAVDELGEIGVGLVSHGQAWQRPLLWVHLPTDLHVDHFHFLTVLQSLTGEMTGQLVRAVTEIQYHLDSRSCCTLLNIKCFFGVTKNTRLWTLLLQAATYLPKPMDICVTMVIK